MQPSGPHFESSLLKKTYKLLAWLGHSVGQWLLILLRGVLALVVWKIDPVVVAELYGADLASCILWKHFFFYSVKFPLRRQVPADIHEMLKTFWDELIVDGNPIEVSAKSTSVIGVIVVQLHLKRSNTRIVYFQDKWLTVGTEFPLLKT